MEPFSDEDVAFHALAGLYPCWVYVHAVVGCNSQPVGLGAGRCAVCRGTGWQENREYWLYWQRKAKQDNYRWRHRESLQSVPNV